MRETHQKYIPAAGHDLFLPLYDPLTRLLGFARRARLRRGPLRLRALLVPVPSPRRANPAGDALRGAARAVARGAAGAAGLRRGTRAGPRSARAVSAEALEARGGDGPRVAAAGRLR